MAILLRDPEAEALARILAEKQGVSLQRAIRTALEAEAAKLDVAPSLHERLQPLIDRIAAHGLRPDHDTDHKAFFDREYGDI